MRELALVTGGAGFVGRHLVEALVAGGTAVRVLDTAPKPPDMLAAVDYRQGSVLDIEAVKAAMIGAHEVYHLAAIPHLWIPDPRWYRLVNVEGTRHVLDCAMAVRVPRIVVTSTEAILRGWRDRDPSPVTERDAPPRREALPGPYTISKAAAHAVTVGAARQGAPVAIVYPTVPVGPGDTSMTAPTQMIRDFLTGATPAFLDSVFNLVPVEDVARGHILAARRGEPRSRYLLGGTNLRLSEILDMLERISGRTMPRRTVPFSLAYAAGLVSSFVADKVTRRPPAAPLEGVRLAYMPREIDSSHAREALGWRAGSVEDALTRAVEWLGDRGALGSTAGAVGRLSARLLSQDG